MKINKKSVIDKTRRVLLVFLAAFIVIYSGFSGKVAADQASSGVSMANVRGKIMEEGKARVVANVLYKCFKLSYDSEGDGWNGLHEGEDVIDVGDIFYNWFNGTGMNGGAWYEKLQQGNVSDGYIDCTEKGGKDALQLFAEYTGVTVVDIICGKNDTPGVYHNDGQAGKCTRSQVGKGKNDQAFVRDSNWESHLKKLYEDHATAEKWYDGRWSEIGNYDEYVGYGMYLQEIQVGCGSEVDASVSHSSNVLKYLDDTGAYIDKYISGNDSSYPVPTTNHSGNRYSFANWGTNKTCNQIIGRASELAPTVQTKMWELISQGCEEAYRRQKDAAQNIVDDPGASDSKKENAQKVIDEFNGLTSYTQDVKNEQNNIGKECIDVEYLMKPIQDDYDPYHDDPTQESTSDPDCYTNAGSLGWILCPIINQVSGAIQGIYTKYITPFLVLDSELFKENSGTYEAWKQFRDIANIIFVIIFIVVIFSQLTGVGIDNYGIKKILPKLIIGAILINLSYIICQLAIDVANIVGYSIGGLFESIQNGIDYSHLSLSETGGETLKQIAAPIILVVLIGLICAGAYLAIGPTVLIPVFMAVISVFIAILFCFILLAVRKAFAVLLVVASPIAFACYMLPNTKPIFDKWFGAFKGVLLAFPICSAMIYGGQMVARIIVMAAGSSNMPSTIALSAAVISIIPIFMIPKAISGSMAAISGGIVGLQNRLTGGARGAIGRSGFAQDMRRRTMMQKSGFKYDKDGNIIGQSWRGKAQDKLALTRGSKQRLAMRRAGAARAATMEGDVTTRWGGAKGAEQAMLLGEAAAAQRDAQEVSDIEAQIGRSADIDNNAALQKGLTDAMVSGDTKRMKAYQNILYGKGEDGRDAARKAVEEAQATGKVTSATLQSYGSNAMNKWAKDLKANARSDFEFAKQAAASGSGAGNIGDYKTIDKAQKYTAENMATMDDSQVKSMVASMGDSSVSQEQKDYAARAAYEALHNDNISLKGERRADLEKLAAGYTPPADASAGGGSESGGVVSPAMLTDEDIAYRNKLKEMSERGDSSPDELHIDHSPSSGGSSSSGGAPKPSTPSPTGTNSGTGKPRAKEGNKFDYYPRQKGESSAAYGQRLNRQKLIEQKYQSDPPKAGESHADWMKRVGIPPLGTSA